MPARLGPSLPLPVVRALRKLGVDIRDARRRRRFPTTTMAERASISRPTLAKARKRRPRRSNGNLRHGAVCTWPCQPNWRSGGRSRRTKQGSNWTTAEFAAAHPHAFIIIFFFVGDIKVDRPWTAKLVVYMDIAGAPVLVGRLWSRIRK